MIVGMFFVAFSILFFIRCCEERSCFIDNVEDAAKKKIDTCRRIEPGNRSDRTEYRSHVGAHDEGTIKNSHQTGAQFTTWKLDTLPHLFQDNDEDIAARFMKIVEKMDEMIPAQPPIDYTTYQTFLKTDFMKFKSHYSGIEWNSSVARLTRIYIFYEHYKDIFTTTRTLGTLSCLHLAWL